MKGGKKIKKQMEKEQAKKSNTRPKKESIDFQLKIVRSKLDELNELKKITAKKSEKKKIDSQLKVLKRKLGRLIKTRLDLARKNIRNSEIAKEKLGSLVLVIEKDLNVLNGKIRLSDSQLKKLRTEKIRIDHKRKDFEKSLEKVKESMSEERKLAKELKSRKV